MTYVDFYDRLTYAYTYIYAQAEVSVRNCITKSAVQTTYDNLVHFTNF